MSPIDTDFKRAVEQLCAGADCDGTRLSKQDCAVLLLKLKCSVDISNLVSTVYELIGTTLELWRDGPTQHG